MCPARRGFSEIISKVKQIFLIAYIYCLVTKLIDFSNNFNIKNDKF